MSKKVKRNKHKPQRTCIACRQKTDKRLLTRLVAVADDGVIVDLTGKHNGRGAYLCNKPNCWEKALNSSLLDQALKIEVADFDKERLSEYQPGAGKITKSS